MNSLDGVSLSFPPTLVSFISSCKDCVYQLESSGHAFIFLFLSSVVQGDPHPQNIFMLPLSPPLSLCLALHLYSVKMDAGMFCSRRAQHLSRLGCAFVRCREELQWAGPFAKHVRSQVSPSGACLRKQPDLGARPDAERAGKNLQVQTQGQGDLSHLICVWKGATATTKSVPKRNTSKQKLEGHPILFSSIQSLTCI